jgi:hypothetical protein
MILGPLVSRTRVSFARTCILPLDVWALCPCLELRA